MGSKILLADDSITIQKVVNLTFADEGIEVISVSNGDMAERRLKEVNPDLVLADIFMPGKNGYELCEAIKQHPQFRDIPVVLLVGAFEPFNESEAHRVNADAHLTKPFESRVLVETVKNLIAKSPQRKSVPVNSEVLHHQAAPEPPPLQSARPLAMPAIDLSAMSNPSAPQESVFADRLSASGLADSTPFADSFPNNFDFSQNQPQEPQGAAEYAVGTSASSTDADPSASAPLTQEATTFEPTPPTPYTDLFNVEGSFQASETAATMESAANYGDVFDTESNFDNSVVLEPIGFEVASDTVPQADAPAGVENHNEDQGLELGDTQAAEGHTDFENPEVIQAQGAQEMTAIAVNQAEAASSQAREYQVEDVENLTAQAARKFDTNELESPVESAFSPTLSEADIASNGNGSSKDLQKNTDFSLYQESSASDPSLLSTDEPLGDVFNDFLSPEFAAPAASAALDIAEPPVALPESQTPIQETQVVPQTQVTSESVIDSLAAEPEPLDAFAVVPEAAFVEESSIQAVVAESPTQAFSLVAPANQESTTDHDRVAEASVNTFAVPLLEKAEPIDVEALMPASTQFNFYTEPEQEATPEAGACESPDAAVVAEKPVAPEASENEEKFTASDMWEAQTQFTPVSIEALPVAELATAPPPNPAENTTPAVTPAAMPVESSPPSESAPAATAPPSVENHLEITTSKEVAMNKEMMDEIVRQVVSQLSDSVIREIAWEVVPDCVERVVTNLTKQDLSRRL